MTQQEYEQIRKECWMDLALDAANMNKVTIDEYKRIFNGVFDKAYALGREKEAISQEEIEKAAEKFADGIKIPQSAHGVMVPFINGLAHDAYLQGARDFLGKQEKDADTVIVDKEEYDKLCKRSRYIANWVPYYRVCPICGEYNPSGCICANCNNDKNWNK